MLLTILVFIFVLGLLIFVHEFGHFIAAKRQGVRVDEFGFGFPPRLFGIRRGETIYSFNAIPLGGFVKIYGESVGGESRDGAPNPSPIDLGREPRPEGAGEPAITEYDIENDPRSFGTLPIWRRVIVVMAGVAGNFALAWLLFSLAFGIGVPSVIEENETGFRDVAVTIASVASGSPAATQGLKPGDKIVGLNLAPQSAIQPVQNIEQVQQFINDHRGTEIMITIQGHDGNKRLNVVHVTPRTVVPEGEGALGISMVKTGTRLVPWYKAIVEGAIATYEYGYMLIAGLFTLIGGLFTTGKLVADVAGPIGIAAMSRDALSAGFAQLVFFTAILSLNLGIINAFPLPALDGGRLLFLIIEKIKGSPVSRKVETIVHTAGFALLMLLMALVTYRDIARIFS